MKSILELEREAGYKKGREDERFHNDQFILLGNDERENELRDAYLMGLSDGPKRIKWFFIGMVFAVLSAAIFVIV